MNYNMGWILNLIVSISLCVVQIQNNLLDCHKVFEFNATQDVGSLFQLTLKNIQPYSQGTKLCFFLIDRSQITKYKESDQDHKNKGITQQQHKNFYLRIDSLPNQCLDFKNDIKFQLLSQQHPNYTHTQNDSHYYFTSFHIKRSCANIMQNVTQLQEITKYQVNLIVEIKQIYHEIFGFPIYKQPFKDISLFVIFLMICSWLSRKVKTTGEKAVKEKIL